MRREVLPPRRPVDPPTQWLAVVVALALIRALASL